MQASQFLHTALYVPPVRTISHPQVFSKFKPNLVLITSLRAEADIKNPSNRSYTINKNIFTYNLVDETDDYVCMLCTHGE